MSTSYKMFLLLCGLGLMLMIGAASGQSDQVFLEEDPDVYYFISPQGTTQADVCMVRDLPDGAVTGMCFDAYQILDDLSRYSGVTLIFSDPRQSTIRQPDIDTKI